MSDNRSREHTKRLEEARELWDNYAQSFDEAPDHGLRDPETYAAWESLFEGWLPFSNLSVLDVGCGTGSLSLLLAGLGHRVTGLDVSPAMLALAKSKALIAEKSIEFVAMDAAFPQFRSQSFDAIVSRHLLWALSERPSVLERWVALLKPGGFLVFVEGFWHTGAGLRAQEILDALPSSVTDVHVQSLNTQPVLWGGEVSDDRYAITARVARAAAG